MRPTRLPVLVAVVVLFGAVGWLLFDAAYGDLPPLPRYAPVSLALLAVVELAMARVVRDRVEQRRRDDLGRPLGRPLHPIAIARAAVLAKASSATGAVLTGVYGGMLTWAFPRRDEARRIMEDAQTTGLSALCALALVGTALLLERACRTPDVGSET